MNVIRSIALALVSEKNFERLSNVFLTIPIIKTQTL